jgi:RHS repeat-associated protein
VWVTAPLTGWFWAKHAGDPAYRPWRAQKALEWQDTDAAGEITAELAEAITARQPLRYAGYVYDTHSATYYLSARHYDPATARFLTKDPARDDGEESAYQYCAGDPVGRVDPSGMWAEKLIYNKDKWWGFSVKMRWPFLSRTYCFAFAADLVWRLGNKGLYKRMNPYRIAIELFAHAAANYHLTYLLRAPGLSHAPALKNEIVKLHRSASVADVNNDERRAVVLAFYFVWSRYKGL